MHRTTPSRPRVLFLFTNERTSALADIRAGINHAGGFWGMIHLPKHGVDATFMELETYLPKGLARFLREKLIRNPYWVHLPLYPLFFKYDIIYTSSAFGTQLIHTLYPFRKPRWVMHDFSIISMIGGRKTLKQKLMYFLVSRCDGIVTLSASEATNLQVMFPHLASRIAHIPYGVDTQFFTPSTATRSRMVFGVGRDPDRDWKTLFKAAVAIPVPINVATRESRVARLRPLPENVSVGQWPVAELLQLYRESSVLVLPLDTSSGLNDAMGCSVIFEALAMGKAIVATHTHAIASYIEDGKNGFLVPAGDADAMADRINRLLDDEHLRASFEQAARRYAETHLAIDAQGGVLATYFIELLSKK